MPRDSRSGSRIRDTRASHDSIDEHVLSSQPQHPMRPRVFIGLIRGINVGGRNAVPMADLRAVCSDLGCKDVQTYVQSGNLIFRATDTPEHMEDQLEEAIDRRFGVSAAVLVRSAAEWQRYAEGNPFGEAANREPNLVMLALSKATPKPDAARALQERAAAGERVAQVGPVLWIHYPGGAGRSKLSAGSLDRFVGSPVTTRNWRTVLKLVERTRPDSMAP